LTIFNFQSYSMKGSYFFASLSLFISLLLAFASSQPCTGCCDDPTCEVGCACCTCWSCSSNPSDHGCCTPYNCIQMGMCICDGGSGLYLHYVNSTYSADCYACAMIVNSVMTTGLNSEGIPKFCQEKFFGMDTRNNPNSITPESCLQFGQSSIAHKIMNIAKTNIDFDMSVCVNLGVCDGKGLEGMKSKWSFSQNNNNKGSQV